MFMIGLLETKILIMELCQQDTVCVPLAKCAVLVGGGATKALYCRQCVGIRKGYSCHDGSEDDNFTGVLRYVAGRTTLEWMIIGVRNGPLFGEWKV